MIDYKQRAGELWAWFRSFPLVVQLGALVVVALLVLWLAGGVESAWSHLHDWNTDRKVAALEADNAKLAADAAKEHEVNVQLTQAVADKDQQLAAKQAEIDQLHTKAEEQDALLQDARRAYEAARRGHGGRPVTTRDDLDRRLRDLFEETAPQ